MSIFPAVARVVILLFLALLTSAPANAFFVGDAPDAYSKLNEPRQKTLLQAALSAAGESSTDNLAVYTQVTGAYETAADGKGMMFTGYRIIAVQDRGLPRGEEYPTFVFRTENDLEEPELIFKTHAGPRIYNSDSYGDAGCLFSAQKGYSDICLVDVRGNPAPELPGLRDDFWSDLLTLLGL